MRHPGPSCLIAFFATCLLAPPLSGQMIYRCANAYSQIPCPGAVVLSVDDSRSPAQKAQTDAAAAQAARSANQMEKERLERERAVTNAAAPRPAPARPPTAGAAKAKSGNKQKNQDLDMFTAFSPPVNKKALKKPDDNATLR